MRKAALAITTLVAVGLLGHSDGRDRISRLFRKNLDCYGNAGCALDGPSTTLPGISGRMECVMLCSLDEHCVGFNFWDIKLLCQFYDVHPYRIVRNESCVSYDVTPRTGKAMRGENLAKHQRTCQSSSAVQQWSWWAVDGVETLNIKTCSHTNGSDGENNWLMVELQGRVVTVGHVRILARQSFSMIIVRYTNLTIGVTNSSWLEGAPVRGTYPLCGVYLGPLPNGTWFEITCTSMIPPARYVIVHQVPVNKKYGGFLSMCELQVYGEEGGT